MIYCNRNGWRTYLSVTPHACAISWATSITPIQSRIHCNIQRSWKSSYPGEIFQNTFTHNHIIFIYYSLELLFNLHIGLVLGSVRARQMECSFGRSIGKLVFISSIGNNFYGNGSMAKHKVMPETIIDRGLYFRYLESIKIVTVWLWHHWWWQLQC